MCHHICGPLHTFITRMLRERISKISAGWWMTKITEKAFYECRTDPHKKWHSMVYYLATSGRGTFCVSWRSIKINKEIANTAARIVEENFHFTLVQVNAELPLLLPNKLRIYIPSLRKTIEQDQNSDRVELAGWQHAEWLLQNEEDIIIDVWVSPMAEPYSRKGCLRSTGRASREISKRTSLLINPWNF